MRSLTDVNLPTWGALALSLLRAREYGAGTDDDQDLWARSYSSIDKLKSRRIDSLLYWKCGADVAEQRLYNRLWRLQRDAIEEVVSRSRGTGVEPIVFKGAEFLASCFDSQSVGMLYDVDLLIPRTEIEEMKAIAHAIGLRQGVYDRKAATLIPRDVAEIARLELTHYELAPFQHLVEVELPDDEFALAAQWNQHPIYPISEGKAAFVIEVDIHHQVALDIPSDDLIARSTQSAIPGARSLSPPDLVWFTTSRLYAEVAMNGKRSLRDFAYLAAYLRRTAIDWDIVLQASTEYEFGPSLYYFLAFLDTFDGVEVPGEVLEQLDPRLTSRLRDWGWQLGLLFEFVDPLPLPDGDVAADPAAASEGLKEVGLAQAT